MSSKYIPWLPHQNDILIPQCRSLVRATGLTTRTAARRKTLRMLRAKGGAKPDQNKAKEEEDELSGEESDYGWETLDDVDDDAMDQALAKIQTRRDAVRYLGSLQADLEEAFGTTEEGRRGRRRPAKSFRTMFEGAFVRVIADEAHNIKTIRTRNHQAVALLQASDFWGLTATPIWNRPIDLCGYLVQLYKDATDAEDDTGGLDREAVLAEFLACAQQGDENDDDAAEKTDPPYHLLASRRLAVLAGRGDMTARQGLIVLPVILKMVCLARDIGDRMDISRKRRMGAPFRNLAETKDESSRESIGSQSLLFVLVINEMAS